MSSNWFDFCALERIEKKFKSTHFWPWHPCYHNVHFNFKQTNRKYTFPAILGPYNGTRERFSIILVLLMQLPHRHQCPVLKNRWENGEKTGSDHFSSSLFLFSYSPSQTPLGQCNRYRRICLRRWLISRKASCNVFHG